MRPAFRFRTLASALAVVSLCARVTAAQGFHPDQRLDVHTGPAPMALVLADLDGDGRPDVATANFTGSSISILLSRGRAFALRTDATLGFGPRR